MKKTIKRVYIAGALTPKGQNNHATEYLANVRRFIRIAIDLIMLGYVPFCPGADFIYFLCLFPGECITEKMIKEMSLEWLEVSDAVLLLKGWENSEGTLAEIEFARKCGIPVFKNKEDLIALRRSFK